jgi:hypothetical protein
VAFLPLLGKLSYYEWRRRHGGYRSVTEERMSTLPKGSNLATPAHVSSNITVTGINLGFLHSSLTQEFQMFAMFTSSFYLSHFSRYFETEVSCLMSRVWCQQTFLMAPIYYSGPEGILSRETFISDVWSVFTSGFCVSARLHTALLNVRHLEILYDIYSLSVLARPLLCAFNWNNWHPNRSVKEFFHSHQSGLIEEGAAIRIKR